MSLTIAQGFYRHSPLEWFMHECHKAFLESSNGDFVITLILFHFQFPGIVSKLLVKKWTVGQLCQFILDYTSGYQQGKRDSTVFTWLADQ